MLYQLQLRNTKCGERTAINEESEYMKTDELPILECLSQHFYCRTEERDFQPKIYRIQIRFVTAVVACSIKLWNVM
jgi:hypothetical protein